ncbi:hypothetical protein C8J57DRAFT_1230796 [Mycena rebaudengoi]|nr:hypothetical protein C8J57DRAFT_1230796 [Mycena rebaudengoi]
MAGSNTSDTSPTPALTTTVELHLIENPSVTTASACGALGVELRVGNGVGGSRQSRRTRHSAGPEELREPHDVLVALALECFQGGCNDGRPKMGNVGRRGPRYWYSGTQSYDVEGVGVETVDVVRRVAAGAAAAAPGRIAPSYSHAGAAAWRHDVRGARGAEGGGRDILSAPLENTGFCRMDQGVGRAMPKKRRKYRSQRDPESPGGGGARLLEEPKRL